MYIISIKVLAPRHSMVTGWFDEAASLDYFPVTAVLFLSHNFHPFVVAFNVPVLALSFPRHPKNPRKEAFL